MTDLDPKHITLAKSLLAQDYTEAQAVHELIVRGVPADNAPRYVSQAVWRLKSERDRLAHYQQQTLIGAALGLIGLIILWGIMQRGAVPITALITALLMFIFSTVAWIIVIFFSEAALWLADRPLLIFTLAGGAIILLGLMATMLMG